MPLADDVVEPVLLGGLTRVRPARSGELDGLAERIATDAEASPWWSDDAEVVRGWFDDPAYHVLVVEQLGTEPGESAVVAGIVAFEEELTPEYKHAGLDISLFEGFVGRGLGPDALGVLGEWLIRERGHHRLTIDPAVENKRAVRAYEKAGFRPVGVMREYERGPDGSWHDNLLMDALAREWTSPGR